MTSFYNVGEVYFLGDGNWTFKQYPEEILASMA
jgi:hypothetical protein